MQSVSQTKSDCFSAFLIDSVIFYLFLMRILRILNFFITFSFVLEQADLSEIEGVISGNSTWPYLMLLFFLLASALVSMLANAFFLPSFKYACTQEY